MKILQICNKPPYPPNEGGSMAMHAVTRMLTGHGCSVKVLAMESRKYPVREADIPDDYRQQTRFEPVFVDTGIRPFAALRALLRNQSYHAVRFRSRAFAKKLRETLEKEPYDIIQLETVYPAVYMPVIRSCSQAKVVIRAHNIEHKIWDRIASHTRNPLKKAYLRILSRQLRQIADAGISDVVITTGYYDDVLVAYCRSLELPLQFFCKPDCKGLCPVCGANLNRETCTCQEGNVVTGPFSALKDYVLNNEEV